MYVVTGNLGKNYEYGQPIPEASEWSPYMLKLHKDAGHIRDVSEDEARQLSEAFALKRKAAKAKQLGRDMIRVNMVLSSAKSKARLLREELAKAVAEVESAAKAAEEMNAKLSEAKHGLPERLDPPPPPAPAEIEAKPTGPTDTELRKKILAEIAGMSRKQLLKYAAATEPESTSGGVVIGSGYGIDLSHVKGGREDIEAAFIGARLAQIKAKE